MRLHLVTVITLAGAAVLLPVSVSAKRAAPKPVPSVIYEGVEYRASLDVETIGHVEAVEVASGRTLWEKNVYHVWIIPWVEEDVQWVFITDLRVQDGKLLVTNEAGKTYKLDPKTGHVSGSLLWWSTWFCMGVVLLAVIFYACKKLKCGRS